MGSSKHLDEVEKNSSGGDGQDEVVETSKSKVQTLNEIASLEAKIIAAQLDRDDKIAKCMIDAFHNVDDDMRLKFGQGPILQENVKSKQEKPFEFYEQDLVHLSGCTGTMILVQEDYLIVANAGDSPVYVFREESSNSHSKHNKGDNKFVGEQLSVDHKPDLDEERERINRIGGVLDQFES